MEGRDGLVWEEIRRRLVCSVDQRLVGRGVFNYFLEILLSELFFLVFVMIVFSFLRSVGLFLLRLMKQGEFLVRNFIFGFFGGFFVMMVVVIMLFVVIVLIWLERKVEIVLLLFLQCLIVVLVGVIFVSFRFFIVLCVMVIVLFERLVVDLMVVLVGVNMLLKKGVQVEEKLMIFL